MNSWHSVKNILRQNSKLQTPSSSPLHPQGVRRWVPALRATLPLTGGEPFSSHVKGRPGGGFTFAVKI